MPSEWQWVFKWFYTKAMPILLGHESLKKMKLPLTDGDKNEYGPLESGSWLGHLDRPSTAFEVLTLLLA
jgi:hypothetical protein